MHRNRELSIVFIVIMVLGMMIVPLPTYIMDLFIAFNICMTLIVLMVVVYIDSPLKLTSFPSILLMLALLRIGITISTSRLILLDGDAGEIITSFGEFVVGGNLIVGIIIFSIITIINFIVITKGSERVAEVSARFSLDAMPGKQMSIDSDLKAGSIKIEQANQMRKELGLESRLFGAMDGAMKFVKGDAIASILDVLINLVGGIIVGVVVNGVAFSKAASTYSILTIGDGLVQQIPALVVSLTAGMMITRVSDDMDKKSLGENIISQIFANYKAIIAASIMLLIMAIIPGMPTSIFLILFVILIIIAWFMYKAARKIKNDVANTDGLTVQDEKEDAANYDGWKLTPLLVMAADNLKSMDVMDEIKKALNTVQQSILFELGVEIPQIVVRYTPKLNNNSYQILIYEIPLATAEVLPGNLLLPDFDKALLHKLGIDEYVPNEIDFGNVTNGVWVSEKYQSILTEFNLGFLTVQQFLVRQIAYVIRKKVSTFLGIQEVKNVIDKMTEYQDLTKELLRMLPLNKITEVLQRLVNEGVSIRNFKLILDTMLEWGQMEKDLVIITEHIRKALGNYIAYKFSNETNIISCFSLDNQLENLIRDSIRFNNNGSYLALDEMLKLEILSAVEKAYNTTSGLNLTSPPVILTQFDIRRYVRYITEARFSQIPVLSFQELEGYAEFNGLGVIQLDNN